MEIRYLDKNRTFTNPTIIHPQYVVVHSTGAGVDSAMTLWKAWNRKEAALSCHAMVDDRGWMLTLPTDRMGWHIGSRGNRIAVGFEICEPAEIRYVDAMHTRVDTVQYRPDDAGLRSDFEKRWAHAVDCAAYLCRQTGLPARQVRSHAEMAAMGKATNHADVQHWFNLFGASRSMDAFRAAVAEKLDVRKDRPDEKKTETKRITAVRKPVVRRETLD